MRACSTQITTHTTIFSRPRPKGPKIVGIVSTFDAAQLKVELAWGMQKNTQKKTSEGTGREVKMIVHRARDHQPLCINVYSYMLLPHLYMCVAAGQCVVVVDERASSLRKASRCKFGGTLIECPRTG